MGDTENSALRQLSFLLDGRASRPRGSNDRWRSMPFGQKTGRSVICPDSHETLRDDVSVDGSPRSIPTFEDADEEIIRPSLASRPGPHRPQPFKSFFKDYVSGPGTVRSKRPLFPGVTENTTTSSTRDKPSELDELFRSLFTEHAAVLGSIIDDKTKQKEKKIQSRWSSLHFAAQKGSSTLCRALLDSGADVNCREDDEWTPLIIAAQNGHEEACRTLIERKADINALAEDGRSALFQACQNGHLEVVKLLIAEGADIESTTRDEFTPLVVAAASYSLKDNQGCMEIVRALVAAGAKVNNIGSGKHSPLALACLNEKPELVHCLLENGADPNTDGLAGKTCLAVASHEASPEIVKALLKHGAKVNATEETNWTPLHLAAQFDKPNTLEVVEILVAARADLNAQVDRGATALFLSVQSKRTDVAEFLIRAGADPNLCTYTGMTPLFRAVADSNLRLVNMLLEHGARTNIVDARGMNIVHYAALQDNPALLRRVLDTEAERELQSTDDHKVRPIHLACQNDNEEIAMVFLEYGVKPN
ncbi:hypothetical protein LTR84_000593 [Exophiala bonariae]|uniref:Uncharacterized protein n=1 Tax=Exophiala bonariae TaxID=1690606 RepID=A0AAV9NSS7_9EURO|nr:hypothetical protein LTR84_000593 [Exophiala bonariae]